MRFGQSLNSARLYVHIARDAPIAAVLRRGPGVDTALLKWDLDSDEVTLGQWVQTRVYERRCDISPDGKYFLYFSARHHQPLNSWTAISILPWFRACVLWQKDDAWGGGALFAEDGQIELNHRPTDAFEFEIHKGNLPRPWRSYRPLGPYSGGGEDEPITRIRQIRDGWVQTERVGKTVYGGDPRYQWRTEGANVIEKTGPGGAVLRLIDDEHGELNGRSYLTECQVLQTPEAAPRSFGRVDWADWHGDDLLFARNGALWRLRDLEAGEPRQVVDLTPLQFQRIVAPYDGAGRT